MKKWNALVLLIMWSYISFSQSLKPKIQLVNEDTVLCFNITQSKIIAKQLEQGKYCDSLEIRYVEHILLMDQVANVKDSTIVLLEGKVKNKDQVIDNQQQSIELLKNLNKNKDKTIKKQKRQKKFLGIGTVIIVIVALLI